MITRRALLSMLALAAADPERLIWQPGKRLISIPKPIPKIISIRMNARTPGTLPYTIKVKGLAFQSSNGLWLNNPLTGNAWTKADIDSVEFGLS